MYKLILVGLIVALQVGTNVSGQGLVPPSMTGAELWNPFSWYYPLGIASANAWADYLKNAQAATNQLYQHVQTVSSGMVSGKPQAPGAGGSNPSGGEGNKPPAKNEQPKQEEPKQEEPKQEEPKPEGPKPEDPPKDQQNGEAA